MAVSSPLFVCRAPADPPSASRRLSSPVRLISYNQAERVADPRLSSRADESNLKHFLSEKNISASDDLEAQCKSDEVRKAVLGELNAVAKKSGLKPLEVRNRGLFEREGGTLS